MITCNSTSNNYQCEIKSGDLRIVADASIDKGGLGEGFRPHDILEAALAACMNMTVRMEAERLGFQLKQIEVKINLERKAQETIFHYSIEILDPISDKDKMEIIQKTRKCPIQNTLSKNIRFEPSIISQSE